MKYLLTWWRSSNWIYRALVLICALGSVICLVAASVQTIQSVPRWVTEWQGAHGHYPTGHLTYTVPETWDTSTLTHLNPSGATVWWDVFDDTFTTWSPTYSWTPPDGAHVFLRSVPSHDSPTIDAWYQHWAEVTDSDLEPGTVLPLADYAHVPLGGQTALCAASQEGSQLLPPHPPASPDFDTTFAGYTPPYVGEAVVMCFTLWEGQVYNMEVTVDLHTASQDTDLRNAARLIESLRFT